MLQTGVEERLKQRRDTHSAMTSRMNPPYFDGRTMRLRMSPFLSRREFRFGHSTIAPLRNERSLEERKKFLHALTCGLLCAKPTWTIPFVFLLETDVIFGG